MDRLRTTRVPDDPAQIQLPSHMAGLKRLPCIRRHAGPVRPTPTQFRRACLLRDLWLLHRELSAFGPEPRVEDFPTAALRTHRWRQWLPFSSSSGHDPVDTIVDNIFQDAITLAWGTSLDAAFLQELDTCLETLPLFALKLRQKYIHQQLEALSQ